MKNINKSEGMYIHLDKDELGYEWSLEGSGKTSNYLISKVRQSMKNGNEEEFNKALDELFPNGL